MNNKLTHADAVEHAELNLEAHKEHSGAVLGYWEPRGVGQHIRLILAYIGVPYQFKNYSNLSWKQDEKMLGMEVSELPYWIDSEVRLSGSGEITRYLANKYSIGAKDENERIKLDILENTMQDLRNNHMRLCFSNGDFMHDREEYCVNFRREVLRDWSTYLDKKKFLMGDSVKYVDFILYELLNVHEMFDPACLDHFPNIEAYMARVENLVGVRDFLRSNEWNRALVYPTQATWYGVDV